jgi:hypothetical protein
MEPTCNIPAQNNDPARTAMLAGSLLGSDSSLVSPTHNPSVKLDALDAAFAIAARNVPIIPIPYGEKGCRVKFWPTVATTNADVIRRWFDVPCNYGCVAKAEPGGIVVWDHDTSGLLERYARETGEVLPCTFTVRSAGKGLPHLYFRHTAKSIALGNRTGNNKTFDWQARDKYVVGPGSVFDEREYTITDDSPIADCPDALLSWIETNSVSEKPKGAGKGQRVDAAFDIEAFLNHYGITADVRGCWYVTDVCPISGRKHAQSTETGFFYDGEHFGFHCFAANCKGSSMTIGQVVSHLAKGDGTLNNLRAPYDGPIWPSKFADVPAASAPVSAPAEPVALHYPIGVWDGTLYGEYAEISTRGNYMPREFFVEALKTVVGAVVGDKLSISNVEGSNPRFYTTLLGLPGIGKDTSIERTLDLFKDVPTDPVTQELNFNMELPSRLLWHPQDVAAPIGACKARVSSASGLAKYLPQMDKKGNITSLGQSRILFVYTELSELLEKCGIDGSGAALVSALCDLYDGTEFSVPALADQKPFGGDVHASILAGIQPERWNELGAGKGVEHSGIHSRWNLIPTEETRRVATLTRPDLTEFRNRLRARLPLEPCVLFAPRVIVEQINDWFQDMLKRAENSPAGISVTARLNVLAWKNALHHAWLRGLQEIDGAALKAGIALAEYQLQVREQYAPLVGDDKTSKLINAIRRVLNRNGGKASLKKIKDGSNYTRWGRKFEDALSHLLRMKEVVITDGEKGQKVVAYAE